jgi:hypothetical protein
MTLEPYLRVQRQYDRELARILERTAKAIRARINRLPAGIGGDVRRAQLTLVLHEITRIQREMWTDVLRTTQRGRKAGMQAAEDALETLLGPVYASLPEPVADAIRDGLRATAMSGIVSDTARIPRELSTRVYHHAALAGKWVQDTIREGLISGLSAKELAKAVYRYVSPTTPGGASYAAMRLARTEINNAFHERQIAGGHRPGVTGVVWNLSGSHKVPDQCNVYAGQDKHDMGGGVFPPGRVPDRPHPQCFCFLTYNTMSPTRFAKALSDGDFDSELDRRTKANLKRLGFTA